MRPLTTYQPKVMLPLANRPLLEHLLLALRDVGIEDVILVVGYREESVRTYFKDGTDWGIRIRYVKQPRQKGTADALLSVQGLIQEPFLVLNGDMILKSQDISTLIEQEAPCVATFQSDHPEDFGVVVVEDGYIRALIEKSPMPPSSLINAGAYLLDPDIFDRIKAIPVSGRGEYELTDALLSYIAQRSLRAHPLSSWLDIGYPWDLLEVNVKMCASSVPEQKGTIEPQVTLHGMVSIGEGTILKSGTYVEGPCVIGKNCVIGPHTFIRGATSIGEGCHIGHSTEIKNSLIMAGTKIPHFNYIGDSVVGKGCNFGAGTKVANLRHDHGAVWVAGKNTKRVKFGAVVGDRVSVGINCSINVGSVLGSDSWFGPGVLIDGSYGEGSRIR